MDLAAKVRLRREQLGLSQEELATKMGYSSRTSINKIEMGRPCTQKIIARLAKALDVSIAWLMGWDENLTTDNADLLADILTDARLLEICKNYLSYDEIGKQTIYDSCKTIHNLLSKKT